MNGVSFLLSLRPPSWTSLGHFVLLDKSCFYFLLFSTLFVSQALSWPVCFVFFFVHGWYTEVFFLFFFIIKFDYLYKIN